MMIFAHQNIVRENISPESYYVLFMSVDILMAYILYGIFNIIIVFYYERRNLRRAAGRRRRSICDFSIN